MAGTFTGSAGALAHLTPRPNKTTFNDNYLSIAGNDFNFTKQFLPEVYEQEVERFGNRTISGFLRMVGAEMPMASDTVTWSEQGRLHIAYDDVAVKAASTSILVFPAGHLISAGMTIVVSTVDGITVDKAFVVSVATNEVTVACYGSQAALNAAIVTAGQAGATLKSFVYGSEYGKKSQDGGASIDAYQLQSKNVSAKVTSGADINVYASESIVAKATSGGDIDFMGNPKKVDKKTSSGGSVSAK